MKKFKLTQPARRTLWSNNTVNHYLMLYETIYVEIIWLLGNTIIDELLLVQVQVQSLLAKSAENMLLAINKPKWIIMLWHIYIWRKKRNTTKEKNNAKTRQHTHTRTQTHKHTHTGTRTLTHAHTRTQPHKRCYKENMQTRTQLQKQLFTANV